jgi:hypothetical protein
VRWRRRGARPEMRTRCAVIFGVLVLLLLFASILLHVSSNGFLRDLHDMKGEREKHGLSCRRGIPEMPSRPCHSNLLRGFAWR